MWEPLKPLPPRKPNSFLSFPLFFHLLSLLCLHQKSPPESSVWIVQEAAVVVSSLSLRLQPTGSEFFSFPLDKCHAWCLQFSLTATSVFVVVVVFLVDMRNTLMVSKVKDAGQRQTLHTHHADGRRKRTSHEPVSGEFSTPVSQSYTQCVFTYSHWWSGRESPLADSLLQQ